MTIYSSKKNHISQGLHINVFVANDKGTYIR